MSKLISDTAREREFCRYYTPRAVSETPDVARSSNDASLTAFAQLGVLRFGAKRALISLFDRHQQHILAEATKSISLQCDTVHHQGDGLRYGQAILPRNIHTPCPCEYAFKTEPQDLAEEVDEAGSIPPHFMIKDISADDRFKPLIENDALKIESKFYCGVPIRSSKGISIGTFAIFDDQPRDSVDRVLIQFMTDVAKTIMQHLESKRLKKTHRRGERMVRGLASFVDGKASMREAHLGSNTETSETDRPVDYSEGQLNATQQTADKEKASLLQDSRPPRTGSVNGATRAPLSQEIPGHGRRTTISEFTFTDDVRENPQQGNVEDSVERMLSRATNIIRESAEVEGAILFDAKISSFGGMIDEVESSQSRSSSSNSQSDGSTDRVSSAFSKLKQEHAMCDILGFSTTEVSSINGQRPPKSLFNLRQTILKRWLARYKYGRVFNFDEDGSFSSEISSGEDSVSAMSASSTKSHYQRRARLAKTTSSRRREDAETLIKMCPGARSIAILPLWDSRREAWYAGLMLWTRSPHRAFTVNEDLSFLVAFGNSIMSEAERIDSLQRETAKTDLLGSISHELRSPLHGILGGVEILADIPNLTTLQSNMIYTIETCGKTLLDIMDHLLDFTKINSFNKKSAHDTSIEKGTHHVSEARQGRRQAVIRDLTSDCDIGLITEEVIEAIAAGQQRLGTSLDDDIDYPGPERRPLGSVIVVLDIQPIQNAFFAMQAGAWRRIVMNLVANSLKYTSSGYVAVTLTLDEGDSRGRRPRTTHAKLTVNDSGKGISAQFLQERIYQPFTQENELNPGTGLGLSLVKKIVSAFKGDIEIASEKDAYTNVTVTIPLTPAATPQDTVDQLMLSSLSSRMKGLTLHMVGFDASNVGETQAEADARPTTSSTKALSLFKASILHLCKNTLQMNVISTRNIQEVEQHETKPDLCLVHPAITSFGHSSVMKILDQMNGDPFKQTGPPVPIVFLCDRSSTAVALETATSRSGRCGPRKVMRAFTSALDRHISLVSQPSTQGKPITIRIPAFIKSHSVDSKSTSPLAIDSADYVSTLARKASTRQNTPSKAAEDVTSPTIETELKSSTAKILLVDDNPINMRLLEAFAKKNKYSYGRASDGLEALEMFKSAPNAFRVILMDISMPRMDGLESTRHIRSHERSLNIHDPAMIVALTGVGSAAIQQEAFASGVDLFLTKPVRFGELSEILRKSTFGKEFETLSPVET